MAAAGDLGRVTVMVNNAGLLIAEDFLTMDEATFDRLVGVDVKGVFFGC